MATSLPGSGRRAYSLAALLALVAVLPVLSRSAFGSAKPRIEWHNFYGNALEKVLTIYGEPGEVNAYSDFKMLSTMDVDGLDYIAVGKDGVGIQCNLGTAVTSAVGQNFTIVRVTITTPLPADLEPSRPVTVGKLTVTSHGSKLKKPVKVVVHRAF